ncbi:MAG: tetratricopeptide repeat protein [Myxococcales bacterium]|nr:tetratricopeptide repeat protein [Myxococcales bacterium]
MGTAQLPKPLPPAARRTASRGSASPWRVARRKKTRTVAGRRERPSDGFLEDVPKKQDRPQMNCPECKSVNRPGAALCKQCHQGLPPNCAGCGAKVTSGQELCAACRTERIPAALGADDGIPELDSDLAVESGAVDVEFRLDPRFTGRKPLCERLRAHLLEAFARPEPLFLLLTGPDGAGKSRLAREVAEGVRSALPKVRLLEARCGGPGTPPFGAFARLFWTRFGITEGEAEKSARAKISAAVALLLPASRAVEVSHLIAHLVRYPFPESPIVEPLAETPTQLEARMFIAVRRFLAADAAEGPLLLVLDDIERASPETVNLLHFLAAGLGERPVALIAVGRSSLFEVHKTFGEGDVGLERVEVGPLSPDESAALFDELVHPAGEPPQALLAHARERMGGSPRALFELTRYLIEIGIITRDGRDPRGWVFDRVKAIGAKLPGTLEELVTARLGAMEAGERHLLEKAAACGEAFWLDAVVALVRAAATTLFDGHGDPDGPSLGEIAIAGDRTRIEVSAALAALERRGLLVESQHSSIPGEREYRFAYPPWWEVIYGAISTDGRRRYHKLIAQWLELRPEGRGEEEQEEIGRHLERAGDGDGASLRYRRAGDAARARYYNDKAIRLFAQAIRCLGPTDISNRIQLWHDLGSVYQLRGEHEPALQAFERMLRLSWVVASRTKAAVAFNKMGRVHRQKGDLNLALEYLERGLEFFKQAADDRGVAGSLDDIGQVQWLLGRLDDALDASAAGLEQRRRIGDRRSIAVSLLNIGHIERHRGLFNEAESCYREALKIRRSLSDRAGVAASLNGLGILAFQRGDLDGARREWEEALGIAEEIGALPLQALLEGHLGDVARAAGNLPEARTRFERSESIACDLDDRRLRSEATRNLGLIELAGGDNRKALELCEKALEIAETAGIRVDVGRGLLSLGEVHAVTLFDDTGHANKRAEDYFLRGVALFREIGNEAELAIGLERFGAFRVETGELEAGRALLTEAHGIFDRLGMKAGDAVKRMIGELG